jgi:hypothetical protein
VHSILRLSYETLKGLISLASRGVAKLTLFETQPDARRTINHCGHQAGSARPTDHGVYYRE